MEERRDGGRCGGGGGGGGPRACGAQGPDRAAPRRLCGKLACGARLFEPGIEVLSGRVSGATNHAGGARGGWGGLAGFGPSEGLSIFLGEEAECERERER